MGLPHQTGAYTVRDEATGEYYAGSAMDINERWATHRKKRTDAWKLLERPTAFLEWVECSIEVARALERAVFYEGGAELAVNKRPPNGKAFKQQSLEELAEKRKEMHRAYRERNKDEVNARKRDRWTKRTDEQKEAKRARDRAYSANMSEERKAERAAYKREWARKKREEKRKTQTT